VAGTLGVAAALALWAPWRASRVDMRPLIRLDVDLGADAAIAAAVVTPATDAIISPDGNRLV
jgi:hypothetical protein